MEQQQYAQEQRMQDEKERLQEQLKTHIRETLRPLTNQIIADVVKREVVERVRQKVSIVGRYCVLLRLIGCEAVRQDPRIAV